MSEKQENAKPETDMKDFHPPLSSRFSLTSTSKHTTTIPSARSREETAILNNTTSFTIPKITMTAPKSAPATPLRATISSHVIGYHTDLHYLPQRKSIADFTNISLRSQNELEESSQRFHALKRKASELSIESFSSLGSHTEEFKELVDVRIKMIREQLSFVEIQISEINEICKKDEGQASDYRDLRESLQGSKVLLHRELAADKHMLKENFARLSMYDLEQQHRTLGEAYSLAIVAQHKDLDRIPEWLQRNEDLQLPFRQDLITIYGNEDDRGRIWCPVVQQHIPAQRIKAAHLVPHLLSYDQVGYLLGDMQGGFGHIWSRRNGLMLHTDVERAFDRAQVVIVPTVEDQGRGRDWQLLVLDESIMNISLEGDTRFADLHGRALDFKDAKVRPRRRYLYVHYMLAMLRIQRVQRPGWAAKVLDIRRTHHKIWATCGRYLTRGTILTLARQIADDIDMADVFMDPDHEDAVDLTPDIAEEIASVAIARKEEMLKVQELERLAKAEARAAQRGEASSANLFDIGEPEEDEEIATSIFGVMDPNNDIIEEWN